MFRIYQPHIYTGKGMDRGHIKPGDTVYPWGRASDLARIGLVSAATCDGRVSYVFKRDMQPATWIPQRDWPVATTAFSKQWLRLWKEGYGYTNEGGYVWQAYDICPLKGPSSQKQRIDMICPEFWNWSPIEDRYETKEAARMLANQGIIIEGNHWNIPNHQNGPAPVGTR